MDVRARDASIGAMSENAPGCVKTQRGITAPRILRLVVALRAEKRTNSSFAWHYDQIRFRFPPGWPHSCRAGKPTTGSGSTSRALSTCSVYVTDRNEPRSFALRAV